MFSEFFEESFVNLGNDDSSSSQFNSSMYSSFESFDLLKTNDSEIINPIKLGKKKGHKPKDENKVKRIHDKSRADNIISKIQIHYFTFLIQFLNAIMKNLGLKYSFYDLKYNYKNNTTKYQRDILEKKTIKEILLEAPITKKGKKEENNNREIIQKLENESIIMINILDKKFLSFFNNIYYRKEDDIKDNINLLNLNFNCNILNILKNVNTFEDIFKKDDFVYKQKVKDIAEKNFCKKN